MKIATIILVLIPIAFLIVIVPSFNYYGSPRSISELAVFFTFLLVIEIEFFIIYQSLESFLSKPIMPNKASIINFALLVVVAGNMISIPLTLKAINIVEYRFTVEHMVRYLQVFIWYYFIWILLMIAIEICFYCAVFYKYKVKHFELLPITFYANVVSSTAGLTIMYLLLWR